MYERQPKQVRDAAKKEINQSSLARQDRDESAFTRDRDNSLLLTRVLCNEEVHSTSYMQFLKFGNATDQ